MFNFNLENSEPGHIIKTTNSFLFSKARILKKLFFFLGLSALAVFIFGLFSGNFSHVVYRILASAFLMFTDFSLFFWLIYDFTKTKLETPRLPFQLEDVVTDPERYNIARVISPKVALFIKNALNIAKKRKIELNSSVLLDSLLSISEESNYILARALISSKDLRKELESNFQFSSNLNPFSNISFQQSIMEALRRANIYNHKRIEWGDIFVALTKEDKVLTKVLINKGLSSDDIDNLTYWIENTNQTLQEKKQFWNYKNLIQRGSVAKDWASGYTITLDKFSTNLTEQVKLGKFSEMVGHKKEIKNLEIILCSPEIDNALLIGEEGTGKLSIIKTIVKKSTTGETPPQIRYKKFKILNLPAILSQTDNQEQIETILDRIFREVISAGDIILVINDLQNYIGVESTPGKIDISGLIGPYLRLPQFRVIATTNFSGLHKNIEQKPGILNFFKKVEVKEISPKMTIRVLENWIPALERQYKKLISYESLKEIVNLADRYFPSKPFPRKAIDVLQDTIVYVTDTTNDKIVLPKHVDRVVSEKTEIPIGKLKRKEKEILLNLEVLIHKRIINQEQAVDDISSALRRARTGVESEKKPIGSFLFLGPTGVGKTETAKALAGIYFGSERNMVRLDMSEFQSQADIPRLLGTPGEEGLLTTPVKENPFSLVLLDEIEKANLRLLNLFLQVLDEGWVTDGLGRKISFRDTIIIGTSNAGYKIILDAIQKASRWDLVKGKLINYLFQKAIFRPEFLNRFDDVVVFKPLSRQNLLDISQLLLNKVKDRMESRGIKFIITDSLKEKIVKLSYDPKFGAREMRRVIQNKVENVLASALLSGKISNGDVIEMNSDFDITILPGT